MLNTIKTFFTDQRGASAVEYGLLVALISVMIIVGATALGTSLNTKFSEVATEVDTAGAAQ